MQCDIYTSDKYKKYFHSDIAARQICGAPFDDSALDIDCIDSGLVAVDCATGAFGIFDVDNKFVKSSLQLRGKMGQFIPDVKKLC